MKFQDVFYCDGCGQKVGDRDISYTYELHTGSDRCLGGSGVDILEPENKLYRLAEKNDSHYYDVDEAIGGTEFIFCDDCCNSWEDKAIRFEHEVRSIRSQVILKVGFKKPKKKPMDRFGLTPEQWLIYRASNVKAVQNLLKAFDIATGKMHLNEENLPKTLNISIDPEMGV